MDWRFVHSNSTTRRLRRRRHGHTVLKSAYGQWDREIGSISANGRTGRSGPLEPAVLLHVLSREPISRSLVLFILDLDLVHVQLY